MGASSKACVLWYISALTGGEHAFEDVIHEESEDPDETSQPVPSAPPMSKVAAAGDSKPKNKGSETEAEGESETPAKNNGTEGTTAASDKLKACGQRSMTCLRLYGRALSACCCECWKESNEELDHQEQRKEGKSWFQRLFASLCMCTFFYSKSFIHFCKKMWSMLVAEVEEDVEIVEKKLEERRSQQEEDAKTAEMEKEKAAKDFESNQTSVIPV